MRTCVIAAVAALLVGLAAGTASADYDSVRGQIKSVDADAGKIVVSVRAGRDPNAAATEQTFLIDKDTTIRVNREKKTIADLQKDKGVTVTFKTAAKEGDVATAVLISVMDFQGMGGGRNGGGRNGGGRNGGGGNGGGGNGGGGGAAPGPQL